MNQLFKSLSLHKLNTLSQIHFYSNLIFGSSNINSLARDCNSHTFCMKASSEHNNMSLLLTLNMIMKQLS